MAHADTEKDATGTMRKALNVEAFPAEADLVTREADFKARVTQAETGATVAGLEIHFRTAKSGLALCTAFTNPEGIAECGQGSVLDPLVIVDALASGYNAVFEGNAEFQPAQGHNAVVPSG
jgi:hypothetical protein